MSDDEPPVASKTVFGGFGLSTAQSTRIAGSCGDTVTVQVPARAGRDVLVARHVAAEAPRSEHEGCVVAGKFRLQRLVGQGGMGAVWEAEHLQLGKRVALKLVSNAHSGHPELTARFRQEARAASAVESEHIVQIFDVDEDPGVGLYMVMELLRGEDMAQLLSRVPSLDPFAACSLVAQAAAVLSKAHRLGIVHRDIKPANIFLAEKEDGTVVLKLLDFGIAKVLQADEAPKPAVTAVGRALGSAQYMAPEQAQGVPDVDQRCDIYALGAVLYEALGGEPVIPAAPSYEQTLARVLVRSSYQPLSRPGREIDPALEALLEDMLQPHPGSRLRDMATVVERILQVYPRALDVRLEAVSSDGNDGSAPRVSHFDIPRVDATPNFRAHGATPNTLIGIGTSAGLSRDSDVSEKPEQSLGEQTALHRERVRRRAFRGLLVAGVASLFLGVAAIVLRVVAPSPNASVSVRVPSSEPPEAAVQADVGLQPHSGVDAGADSGVAIRDAMSAIAVGSALPGTRAAPRVSARPVPDLPVKSKPVPSQTSKASEQPSESRTGTAGVADNF